MNHREFAIELKGLIELTGTETDKYLNKKVLIYKKDNFNESEGLIISAKRIDNELEFKVYDYTYKTVRNCKPDEIEFVLDNDNREFKLGDEVEHKRRGKGIFLYSPSEKDCVVDFYSKDREGNGFWTVDLNEISKV
ncbi:hypothetical protein ABEY43_06875 [Priestia megaterium]